MNTITIYIHIIVGGDRGAMQYGVASEIKNYVRDFRGKLPYNSQTSSLLALSLISTSTTRGALYTIIKAANGGRPQDYISCDIFVPAEVKISKDEVVDLLKKAENIISNDELKDETINSLVSKTYATKKALPQFTSSRNDSSYAVRYYGKGTDYSLEDIVESPFQNYYANYGYIILSNKGEGISFSSAQADLTNKPIVSLVEIEPAQNRRGFILSIDGIKLDHTISIQEGTTHKLTWSKEGYAELEAQITIKKGMTIPTLRDSDIIMRIPLTHFHVVDGRTNKGIPYHYDADFMQKSSKFGKYIDIKEQDFSKAAIRFSADGYKLRTLPLKDAMSVQLITLEECRFVYNIELTINSVSYTGQKVANHELDWYDLLLPDGFKHSNKHLAYGEDQINRATWTYNQPQRDQAYEYVSERRLNERTGYDGNHRHKKHSLAKRALIGGAMLLFVVLFTGLIWPGWFHNDKHIAPEDQSQETLIDSAYVNQLVKYLDNSDQWSKDSLNKYQLQNLYDAMNNYKFDDIIGLESNDSLKRSSKFSQLLAAINEIKNKGITVPSKVKPYSNDGKITLSKYIEYIKDPSHFKGEGSEDMEDSFGWAGSGESDYMGSSQDEAKISPSSIEPNETRVTQSGSSSAEKNVHKVTNGKGNKPANNGINQIGQ